MGLRERLTRNEEKIKAAKQALKLARGQLSKNGILQWITVIIAIAAVILAYFKK